MVGASKVTTKHRPHSDSLQALSPDKLIAELKQANKPSPPGSGEDTLRGYEYTPADSPSTQSLIVTYRSTAVGSSEPMITIESQSLKIEGTVSGVTHLTKHYYILEGVFVKTQGKHGRPPTITPVAHFLPGTSSSTTQAPALLSTLVEQGLSAVAGSLRETIKGKSKSSGGVFGLCWHTGILSSLTASPRTDDGCDKGGIDRPPAASIYSRLTNFTDVSSSAFWSHSATGGEKRALSRCLVAYRLQIGLLLVECRSAFKSGEMYVQFECAGRNMNEERNGKQEMVIRCGEERRGKQVVVRTVYTVCTLLHFASRSYKMLLPLRTLG